ncbi:WhiB family transcriptional regulator [Streptomyces poriferorum]|uniref:Transcriptional regulator WhiB n=1 Tax=Streptomyces poriferorum TaxID=2798799 RepID=A0ABY9IYK7_9ACTN|nr:MULTISPECIES: WhiB family transcriptional regulator [unclassified Streptomyces]MDP5310456.1 WhiB family transcriptional regulator [Streptomyces sp. Alt4]WLQ60390.1 WhiB family transcriptional regulator [Streptomyces sp. Alt2]
MNDTWREDALCRQTDPEIFHPEVGGTAAPAKRTCMACEVRRSCLDYAVEAGEQWGIWGGLGQPELRRLIRARRVDTEAA